MRILYATDGSEGALAGARFLRALPHEGEIRLVTVAGEPDSSEGRHALEVTREALGERQPLSSEVRCGHAADEILRAAEEAPADLIVIGASGHGALTRLLLGSVVARVVRHACCPVLVARPLRNDLKTAILGFDGSRDAAEAAEWMQRFPLPPGCEVRLVMALVLYSSPGADPPERRRVEQRLEACAEELARAGKRTSAELREDEPASGLLAAADEHGADLLVVGAHGTSAIERFLLGSVSEKVMRLAPCSVIVVRNGTPGTR